jgi:protein gp37
MSTDTRIEWATHTWNPITGCSPISEGCAHCYARRMANRLRGRFGYPEDDPFRVTLHEDRLEEPLIWKKPRRVFTCSMGDLFHEGVAWEWIDRVFIAISKSDPRHTFILLTKRPFSALRYRNDGMIWYQLGAGKRRLESDQRLWFGTTTENQKWYEHRVSAMLQFPAGKHFISAEPLLGPLDLSAHIDRLDWVIVGAETGPGARPLKIEWVESIIGQCKEARVPVFVKKLGQAGEGIKWKPEDYREWPEDE